MPHLGPALEEPVQLSKLLETGLARTPDEVAVISGWRPTLTGGAEPESIAGEQVSHEYFSVLGIVPALGRTFRAEDDVPNAPRVVMISDGIWRRHFGGAPDVIGRSLALSGQPHEVIGVLPAGFRPIVSASAELWRPLRLNTVTPSRGAVVLRTVARLPRGLTIEEAQALWRPSTTYLNTASYGLPPESAWSALQEALEDWRGGRTSWEHWGIPGEAARAAFARLVGVDVGSVAIGPNVSTMLATVAATVTGKL